MKVLEHYVSVQGEGPRTGTLTQFVRFAGCNLRCPGWPCDTPQAIFPDQYRGQYDELDAEGLRMNIRQLVRQTGASNICLTGGEPFIQPVKELDELLDQLQGLRIEVFTNGTRVIPPMWLAMVQINMDWKLDGSGEGQKAPDIRMQNARDLKGTDMIKFVIKDMQDLEQADAATQLLKTMGVKADLWAGVAFGHMKESQLVEQIIQRALPWKFNCQVHKYIWSPEATLV
jgi:7-carboxy-7-deazaguanine synthase